VPATLATIRYALIGVAVVLLQWLLLGRMTIFGAAPDVVILFVAWFGLQFGRRAGATCGFLLGVLMDAAYDMWGVHMLLKTILGFVVGSFASEDRDILTILPRQALLGGFVGAFIHNGLLVLLLAVQAGATNSAMLWSLWVGAAAYTALLGFLAALFARR
jgi:rod shape-determining protein MreD